MTESYTTLQQTVPTRFLAKCAFCPHELDIRAEGSYQHISGWAPVNRSGGGVNALSLPQKENLWAHKQCIEREARGYAKQESML